MNPAALFVVLAVVVVAGFAIWLQFEYDQLKEDFKISYAKEFNSIVYEDNQALKEKVSSDGFKGVTVKVLSEQKFSELSTAENSSALYNPYDDTIYTSEKLYSTSAALKSLYHEFGHHVWWKILSDSEQSGYCSIYENEAEFVSTYAMQGGCDEDFAESYAYYMLGKYVPDRRSSYFVSILEKKYKLHN